MTHKEIKQALQFLLSDELEVREKEIVQQHLDQCDECRKELLQLKHMFEIVGQQKSPVVTEQLLSESRRDLHTALITERTKPSLSKQIGETIDSFISALTLPSNVPPYAFALSGLALFVVGTLLGYLALAFNQNTAQYTPRPVADAEIIKNSNYEINNVQFVSSDTGSGKVEVAFDAVRHLRVKGNAEDENVKKLLAYALVNESNVGVRLKSLGIIKASQQKLADKDMKASLIKALKTDENAGVRREALAALEQLPFDSDVKESFLYVLTNDNNPGLRISAIDGLVTKFAGQIMDQEMLKTLKEKMQSDDNKYIRVRAQNLLEDIKQQ